MARTKVEPESRSVRLQEHELGWLVRYREMGQERERMFPCEQAALDWIESVGAGDEVVRPEEMSYLLATEFVEWVAEYMGGLDALVLHCGMSDRWARACYRWRREAETVSVFTADEFLCWLNGPHLSEVPEEFYVDWHRRIGSNKRERVNS